MNITASTADGAIELVIDGATATMDDNGVSRAAVAHLLQTHHQRLDPGSFALLEVGDVVEDRDGQRLAVVAPDLLMGPGGTALGVREALADGLWAAPRLQVDAGLVALGGIMWRRSGGRWSAPDGSALTSQALAALGGAREH